MNHSLLAFTAIMLCVMGLIGYFLRGALFSITSVAALHARIYAVAYVKGASLVYIAATAAFESAYWALDEGFRAGVGWAPYVIFFNKPISGGLAVLVAFLDRSTQRATEDAAKPLTNPPFPVPPTPPSP